MEAETQTAVDRSARVAVTGVGVIAPGAIGTESFGEFLRQGRSAIRSVERFETEGLRAQAAALVENFRPRDFIPAMKMRRMNTLSRLALSAARMAFSDPTLQPYDFDPLRVGVSIGTCFGPVETSAEYLREYVEKGASLASPQLFAESVANAPGSHVAIEYGLRGFNLTFTQRESSAMSALTFAATQIVKGSVDASLVGGVDEMNEILFAALDRIGALGDAEVDGGVLRPFDRRRDGLLVGEGGVVLILEPAERVGGRVPWGWLSGFGMAKDRSAPISDWGSDPEAAVTAMSEAIADAGLEPGDIDAVWASANGSVRGDRLEAAAIRRLFGKRMPPVVATKGYFGEYAAGGGLHLVSALLSLRDQELPASAGFEEAEPGMELPIVQQRCPAKVENLLVNSLSAGGGIVCAVMSNDADR